MRINELFRVRYNSTLNPNLWDNDQLKPEVADKLHQIADAFTDFINVPELAIQDIIITGSNANYNWTEQSDIDLHLIVDISDFRLRCPELADEFFNDKKTLWNDQHDIEIYDQPVEVYVQPSDQPHVASGQYSLSDSGWIVFPEYRPPKIDDTAVMAKVEQYKYEIDHIIEIRAGNKEVDRMKYRLGRMRRSGLARAGEFSVENITFKTLRNAGYIGKLYDYGDFLMNKKYSLDRDLVKK
jgi:hypothetical protein